MEAEILAGNDDRDSTAQQHGGMIHCKGEIRIRQQPGHGSQVA